MACIVIFVCGSWFTYLFVHQPPTGALFRTPNRQNKQAWDDGGAGEAQAEEVEVRGGVGRFPWNDVSSRVGYVDKSPSSYVRFDSDCDSLSHEYEDQMQSLTPSNTFYSAPVYPQIKASSQQPPYSEVTTLLPSLQQRE